MAEPTNERQEELPEGMKLLVEILLRPDGNITVRSPHLSLAGIEHELQRAETIVRRVLDGQAASQVMLDLLKRMPRVGLAHGMPPGMG